MQQELAAILTVSALFNNMSYKTSRYVWFDTVQEK